MSSLPGPRFLNTILLGSDTAGKLDAAAAAGFAQVELWREDVESSSVAEVRATLTRTGLHLTDVQVLLDFDGASAATREGKRAEALSLLALAHDMGAGTVLVPACTATDYVPDRVTDDLRWLCARAAERGLRIAYEGMAWSRLHSTLPSAWQQIEQVGAPNLDIVVDAFHLFAAGRTADQEAVTAWVAAAVEETYGVDLEGVRIADTSGLSDGTRIPVELRTIVIHDAQGAFARTFTVARDLRPLKEMQERLIHAGRLAAVIHHMAG